jgi:hypothetical protein
MNNKEKAEKLLKELKELGGEWKQKVKEKREKKEIKKAGDEEVMRLKKLYLGKMAVLLADAKYVEKDAELYDVKIMPSNLLSNPPKLEDNEIGKTSSKQFTDDGLTVMTIVFEDAYVIVAWRKKKK